MLASLFQKSKGGGTNGIGESLSVTAPVRTGGGWTARKMRDGHTCVDRCLISLVRAIFSLPGVTGRRVACSTEAENCGQEGTDQDRLRIAGVLSQLLTTVLQKVRGKIKIAYNGRDSNRHSLLKVSSTSFRTAQKFWPTRTAATSLRRHSQTGGRCSA